MRLFNPFEHESHAHLASELLSLELDVTLLPYEIKSYRISNGTVVEIDLLENKLTV